MNHKLELPIGASAEVFGKNVVCEKIKKIPCDGCVFYPENESMFDEHCAKIACYKHERSDREYIILKPAE